MSMFPMTFDIPSGDTINYQGSSGAMSPWNEESRPSSGASNPNYRNSWNEESRPSSGASNPSYRSSWNDARDEPRLSSGASNSSYRSSWNEAREEPRPTSGASNPSYRSLWNEEPRPTSGASNRSFWDEEPLTLSSTWPRPRQTTPHQDLDLWDVDSQQLDLDLSHQLAAKLLMVAPDGLDDFNQDPDEDPANNPRFKTEICRNYKEKGTCLYGDLCQFAHGRDELRMKDRHMNVTQDVVRHNKYKTKLCQKFWIAGYCAYGSRCNFVHNENERDDYSENDNNGGKEISFGCPNGDDLSMPPPRLLPQRFAVRNKQIPVFERKTSLVDSAGESGSDFDSRTPSMSPPGTSMVYHKPMFGSGRFAAHSQEDIFTWVDTWTQK